MSNKSNPKPRGPRTYQQSGPQQGAPADRRGPKPGGAPKGRGPGQPFPKGRGEGRGFDQRPDSGKPAPAQGRRPYQGRQSDPGYEESSASNRQYDRYGKGRGQGRPAPGRPGTGERYGRPAFPRQQDARPGSPASQRFGPGSQTGAPSGYRKPAPHSEPIRQAVPVDAPVAFEVEADLSQVNLLTGRNPIREAIKTGRDLEKLMIAKGDLSGSAREIVSLAKKAGIMIQSVERTRLDQLAKNHQGMIAFASAYQYATVEDILKLAEQRGEAPFIIVLDQITDPHNLGAVIRTAACAGAHGVIVPLHRAVGLTPAAVKASAGAVEHIKVARVNNLNNTIKDLQRKGVWFYAAQTQGEDYRSVQFSGACALVIGSEGEGVSQLTASLCDKQIHIPMQGDLNSLNASVAAGVLMYAVYNTRHPINKA